MSEIFRPAWHFVGLASSIAQRGAYNAVQVLGQPVIVVRTDDGLRAYRNSCRHRGSILVEAPSGVCGGFRCKYHNWVYTLDGILQRAPGTEESSSFDPHAHKLNELPLESINGLVFVSVDTTRPRQSARDYFGDFAERITVPYRVDEMVCVHREEYVLESNWKLYLEVDMETLHTDYIHSSSIGPQPVSAPATSGEWITVYNESKVTPALFPDERHLGFPKTVGISGTAEHGTHFSVLSPGFFLVTAADCMWWIQKTPESPVKTRVNVGYCFSRSSTERDDFDEVSSRYIQRLNQVIREDDWITEYQQKGLEGSEPGCYTPPEKVVHRLDNWILDRVLRDTQYAENAVPMSGQLRQKELSANLNENS
ncbi:aromatic ring-hydroxylating oxygenase subunit alpha [Dietzia maris]